MKRSIRASILLIGLIFCTRCDSPPADDSTTPPILFDSAVIVQEAKTYLTQEPVPLTSFVSERSAGGKNDFYSEGDYWWPNPEDPDGPYIRKDGQTNPDNFVAHRLAMRDLSRWVASLTAAFLLTKDVRYADQAYMHLHTWFIDSTTMMNPSLLYAQAIKGKVTGRGIGIIDTIHLIEVAQSILKLRSAGYLTEEPFAALQKWFDQYVTWLNTHPYGLDEKDHGNNHSTWWAAQVAAFATLANRQDILEICREQFKKLLTEQMNTLGEFPDELSRTKPYNYALFNLEGYCVLAELASTPEDDLWYFESDDGTLQKAIEFMFPAIQDKSTWTYPQDVQHFDELPIQSASLLFAADHYHEKKYLELWRNIPSERKSKEIDRNFPLRQLSLWK